jgi:hypothetical protein
MKPGVDSSRFDKCPVRDLLASDFAKAGAGAQGEVVSEAGSRLKIKMAQRTAAPAARNRAWKPASSPT